MSAGLRELEVAGLEVAGLRELTGKLIMTRFRVRRVLLTGDIDVAMRLNAAVIARVCVSSSWRGSRPRRSLANKKTKEKAL